MSGSWQQTYSLFGQGVAVSALLAALPIFVLLLLLGVLRRPAWIAALTAWATAMLLALFGFHMPVALAGSSALYGAAFGLLPISWIVFWAIALYKTTTEAGKFHVIQASVGNLASDARIQALLIAFCLGGFLEGAAGFGTPVAIASAMLVGLGFSPFRAAALCLIANTAPVAFGSIGIPVITLAGITGLPLDKLSGTVGALCSPLALIIPLYLVVVLAGWQGAMEVWPALLVTGGTFGVCEYAISNFIGPGLTDILAALITGGALLVLLRFWKPAPNTRMLNLQNTTAALDPGAGPSGTVLSGHSYTKREVFGAWMPYGLLVVFVLLWGYKPVQRIINLPTRVVNWPQLHNLVHRMPPVVGAPTPYGATYQLNWISASGTACMFATIIAALLLGFTPFRFLALLGRVCKQLALPTLTVASILSMAFVMNYSGATATLGLAFAGTGVMFPFFSPVLGWLGVFLTGSDTSSNALFGSMQTVTAGHLHFSPVLMAAASSSGGVMGKMISLQTIVIAGAATGMPQSEQARLFRFTLKHSIALVTAIGIEVLLYAYVFTSPVPH
jgi:L-lactate transport